MTSYTLRQGSPAKTKVDLVVVAAVRTTRKGLSLATGGEEVAAAYGRKLAPLLSSLGFSGEPGSVVRLPAGSELAAAQLLVVGIEAEPTREQLRRAAGIAARRATNASSVALALPATDAGRIAAVVEGFASGLYAYRGLKSGRKPAGVADVTVISPIARRQESAAALDAALLLDAARTQARDWVNDPPNDLTPATFADQIGAMCRKTEGLSMAVIDAAELARLGAGGITAVGAGSANPPALVQITWAPEGATRHVALVGKGITYDSGGLTIKPATSMPAMKNDMGGAAAVAAAMQVIALRELPVKVTAWLPLAENAVSGSSMRPGDVLTTLSGRTVEVRNTDAEGRLVLADALTLATREEPDRVLAVATLTAHTVLALGRRVAGLLGDDEVVHEVEGAAETSGEMLWRLPITPEVRAAVREDSSVADLLQHNWVRWGAGLYAAAFVEVFAEGRPWALLDIAGPAWNPGEPWEHVPSGGTGYAVSTLVEYVAAQA